MALIRSENRLDGTAMSGTVALHGRPYKGVIRRQLDNAFALLKQPSSSRGAYELVDNMADHEGVLPASKERVVEGHRDLVGTLLLFNS